MKVEIWSDFACPFCYIGKRHFEKALEQFEGKENVEVEWKSYQLSPEAKPAPGKSIHQYLAELKGQSVDWAKAMNDRVTEMAAKAGLDYRMDKVIVANTFDAHRLSHLAKASGKQDEMEEKLFAAYFTNGRDIADKDELKKLATDSGIDPTLIEEMLNSYEMVAETEQDIHEAYDIGVRGVPFFVFNRKYAVSGAQPVEIFLKVLHQAQNGN